MTFKRFFQLFIFYALSIIVPLFIIHYFSISEFKWQAIILILFGYIILTLPLTVLTLSKQK